MLHAIAELGEHVRRHVLRALGHEVHADALRADQPHDLVDLLEQRLGRVAEQQVGLVEEEAELRLREVAFLGQVVVEPREHPQHERGGQHRLVLHVGQLEHVHDAAAVRRGADEVMEVELGLAEERFGALGLELDHLAQQHADGLLRHAAVRLQLGRALVGKPREHGAQVGEVEQQQSLVVAVLEDHREHARLRVVQVQHARQQERPERADGRADLRAVLPGQAQELDGAARRLPVVAGVARAGVDLVGRLARHGNPRDVALDVGEEHRHALRRQLLGRELERLGLAGAGRSGDEAVPVHHAERDADGGGRMARAVMDDGAKGDGGARGREGLRRGVENFLIHGMNVPAENENRIPRAVSGIRYPVSVC
jgi:hypothetical protein